MALSRLPKFMPEDGSKPKHGVYACRTCKEWFASSCGRAGHQKKHPDHQLYSLLTDRDLSSLGQKRRYAFRQPESKSQNGHFQSLNGAGAVTKVLLQSAFSKLREEVTAELDRLEQQLFPATQNLKPVTSRRTYVAR